MATIDTLVDDFQAMLTQAQELLTQSGAESGEAAQVMRAEVQAKLLAAKLRLQEIEGQAIDSVKAVKDATDAYVHENPWRSVGIAAAIGFVAGVLLSRR